MTSLTVGGVELTIKDLIKNKEFICPRDCWTIEDCELKHAVSLNPTKNKFIAVIITLNAKNLSSKAWDIRLVDWELVDTDAYAYSAHDICNDLRPPRVANAVWDSVNPGTQVDFILVFPEIEKGKDIARLLYVKDKIINIFKIKEFTPEASILFEKREQSLEIESIENDWELRQLRESIELLDATIYSRLNNVLIPKEMQRLENIIQNESYRIEQKLRGLSKNKQDLFRPRYDEIMTDYHTKVEALREKEKKVIDLNRKVESLKELTPREFEEYIAEMFKALGFENINLTPFINDKGIDILMGKNGKKYAVQCKLFKGVVGSPVVQTFLGALENAQVSHGFIVTTSTFSIEAEKMASGHPIELIDGIKLGQLIQQALDMK